MSLFINTMYVESMICSQDSSDQNSHFFSIRYPAPECCYFVVLCVVVFLSFLAGFFFFNTLTRDEDKGLCNINTNCFLKY